MFYEWDRENLWERDGLLVAAAGRQSDGSGASCSVRDMDWMVKDGSEAVALARRLRVYPWADVRVEER